MLPATSPTFTEDILTSYSVLSPTSDPTMDGSTPGLFERVALDEPLWKAVIHSAP